MKCIRCDKQLTGKQALYCSTKCKQVGAVSKRRRKIKQMALVYKGGKCEICGYNNCAGALQFHHPNNDKEFSISAKGVTRSWEKVRHELDKCMLLCANCHAETHNCSPVV